MRSKKKWSEMTVAEHLDAAQVAFENTMREAPNANGLHAGLIMGQAHVGAAEALSNLAIVGLS